MLGMSSSSAPASPLAILFCIIATACCIVQFGCCIDASPPRPSHISTTKLPKISTTMRKPLATPSSSGNCSMVLCPEGEYGVRCPDRQPTCADPEPGCWPQICYRHAVCVCVPGRFRNAKGRCVTAEGCRAETTTTKPDASSSITPKILQTTTTYSPPDCSANQTVSRCGFCQEFCETGKNSKLVANEIDESRPWKICVDDFACRSALCECREGYVWQTDSTPSSGCIRREDCPFLVSTSTTTTSTTSTTPPPTTTTISSSTQTTSPCLQAVCNPTCKADGSEVCAATVVYGPICIPTVIAAAAQSHMPIARSSRNSNACQTKCTVGMRCWNSTDQMECVDNPCYVYCARKGFQCTPQPNGGENICVRVNTYKLF